MVGGGIPSKNERQVEKMKTRVLISAPQRHDPVTEGRIEL